MSKNNNVQVIVEGMTELEFIKQILAPYCACRGIFMRATMVSKKGQKGGDVHFQRIKRDIGMFLQHSNISVVSTFVDYYGVKKWPGKDSIAANATPNEIATCLNRAAQNIICQEYASLNPAQRFIPYMSIHEFEALLFSDTQILARHLGIPQSDVDEVLAVCGSPEQINNSPLTAPSKRLTDWCHGHFGKTTTGIAIAEAIGIEKMRVKCPLFNAWLNKLECKLEK